MGIGGISIWQLIIILAIVVMLFGTKRLRGLGGDLGGAIKGFKKAMGDDNTPTVEDKSKSDDGTADKAQQEEPSKTGSDKS